MAKKEMIVSSEGLEKLKQELEELKTVRRQEIAEKIETARAFGDLSENSEYDEAKNEQAKLYGRIAEVENILTHAVVIDEAAEAAHTGTVGLGCTVKVHDVELDEDAVYTIVGSQEANPRESRISDDSPFGRAMIGKHIGDVVEVEAPIGIVKFEILAVER